MKYQQLLEHYCSAEDDIIMFMSTMLEVDQALNPRNYMPLTSATLGAAIRAKAKFWY